MLNTDFSISRPIRSIGSPLLNMIEMAPSFVCTGLNSPPESIRMDSAMRACSAVSGLTKTVSKYVRETSFMESPWESNGVWKLHCRTHRGSSYYLSYQPQVVSPRLLLRGDFRAGPATAVPGLFFFSRFGTSKRVKSYGAH